MGWIPVGGGEGAVFDTPLTPVASSPANTSNATLFTASAATAVLVDVANIGAASIAVKVGITPSGGSVHWKLFEVGINAGDAILGMGPWFLESGDVVTVQTDTADDATFSLTGMEASA